MDISSPSFENHTPIPKKHTADGDDVSPKLIIANVPPEAKSLVLIVDDPDAPRRTFVHWVAWNIPAFSKELPEGVVPPMQGINSFGEAGWRGPSPPPGKAHRYFFKLYALDIALNIASDSRKEQIEAAMEGHILAKSELVGTYQR